MELLQDFFVTAFVAVLCYFLISKLVSTAMATGDSTNVLRFSKSRNVQQKTAGDHFDKGVMEDLHYFEKLKVEGFASEKRMEFVGEGVQSIDEFFGGSIKVGEVEKSVNRDAVIETECTELASKPIEEGLKEDDKSSEDMFGKCEGEFQANNDDPTIEEKQTVVGDDLLEENREIVSIGMEFRSGKDGNDEEIQVVEIEQIEKSEGKKIELDSDEDDWEGIERSELDHMFAKAVKLVESGDKHEGLRGAGSDVHMELYGLHKVATEGPCHEQPPLALKVAARAKWNAWQRLGNMNPDVAMEQYIALVSDKIPGWVEGKSTDDDKPGLSGAANPVDVASNSSTSSHQHITEERNPEVAVGIRKDDGTSDSKLEDKVKE